MCVVVCEANKCKYVSIVLSSQGMTHDFVVVKKNKI